MACSTTTFNFILVLLLYFIVLVRGNVKVEVNRACSTNIFVIYVSLDGYV